MMVTVGTHHGTDERMKSRDQQRPTPALMSTKEIAQVTAFGALVCVASWLFFPGFLVQLITITVGFPILMGILTALAYRHARKHGEWPPKDEQR
jgi:hypothetical protein